MLRLLNIEFIKLWNNKASRTLIMAYFILLSFIALIASIEFKIGPIEFSLREQGIFDFPYIWHFNTFIAGTLKFFLLIVIVSMVANEYSNKTLKQNLIDGMSKKEFILSKVYMVLAFSFISTLFVFIISLVLGLLFSSTTEVSFIVTDLEYLLAYFVKLFGFFCFGLFAGLLIKRSAFALGGIIVYFFFELFSYWIVSGSNDGSNNADNIYQFLPFKSLWNLIDEPFSRTNAVREVANVIGETVNQDFGVHWYEIAIVLAWSFIFIFLSYQLLLKRDL